MSFSTVRKLALCFSLGALLPLHFSEADTGAISTQKPRPVASRGEYRPHIGLRGGMADPSQNYGTSFEYGVDVGYQPYVPFGLGAEFAQSVTSKGGKSDERLTRNKLLARGTYNFSGNNEFLRRSYVGYDLGAVIDNAASTSTSLAHGPLIGFDVPLNTTGTEPSQSFTLGASLAYLFVGNARPDSLDLNARLKYWF
jgi:hypothetical protein